MCKALNYCFSTASKLVPAAAGLAQAPERHLESLGDERWASPRLKSWKYASNKFYRNQPQNSNNNTQNGIQDLAHINILNIISHRRISRRPCLDDESLPPPGADHVSMTSPSHRQPQTISA